MIYDYALCWRVLFESNNFAVNLGKTLQLELQFLNELESILSVLQVIAKGETVWPWRSTSLPSDPLRQHTHREYSFARVGDQQASCQRVTFRRDGGLGSNWPAHQWILWRVRSHAAQTTPHTMS